MAALSRAAAWHAANWRYDPWYRYAWFVWPQALALLIVGWLLGEHPAPPPGGWAKPADCSRPNSACAARHALPAFPQDVINPTFANNSNILIDQTAFSTSALADRPRLSAALAFYYRADWQKGIDVLKAAAPADRNVRFMLGMLNLGANTLDSQWLAQGLLRVAAEAGQRQAGVVLGRMLVVLRRSPNDVAEGIKLIENGVAGGDTYAMRLLAVGFLSGEFGTRDTAKAFALFRQAADAGDPVALEHLAWFYYSGLGGAARDEAKARDYLHRAAEAGVTSAQFMLARWNWDRYDNRETENLSDTYKWYERAYRRGYSSQALVNLALTYWSARPPLIDATRPFPLLKLCAPYAFAPCHAWYGVAYAAGVGVAQDQVRGYAHYMIARQLGEDVVVKWLEEMDAALPPASKAAATQLAVKLLAELKPVPEIVHLQTAEAMIGPSPWDGM